MHLLRYLPFLLLVAVTGSRKIDEILKKVAKRYRNPFGPDIEDNFVLRRQWREDEWNALSDEEIARRKLEQMETIGKWFEWQSTDDIHSRIWGEKLTWLFSRWVNTTICGSETILNYYQTIRYLEQNRKNYVAWSNGGVLGIKKYNLEETQRDHLNFTVTFDVKSKLGSVQNVGFKVTASLNSQRLQDWCDYIIRTIEVLGDCPDHGKVGGVLMSQQELWKKDTEVQKVLRMFSRDAEVIPLLPTQLPHGWLEALEHDEKFSASTCSPQLTPNSLTMEQFRRWYGRLDTMWHPKGELSAQILELKEGESIDVRITMPLQLGWNETQPVHEWEFKIKAVYNTRGDNQWYITTVHALCPPGIHITEEYRKTLPIIASQQFVSRVNDLVQWFSALDFLYVFLSERYELQVCSYTGEGDEKFVQLEKIQQLQHLMWKGKPWRDSSLDSYGIDFADETGSFPNYLTDFSMHVAVKKTAEPKTKSYFEGTWKFTIEYSDADMFYYIKKAEFGCMEKKEKPKHCPWKLCNPFGNKKYPIVEDN